MSSEMASDLGPQLLAKLTDFVGYGPAKPRFVFIGAEEGSEGSTVNLEARFMRFPQVRHDRAMACSDLAAAFQARGLPREARRYLDALTPGAEDTWTLAARLVASLRQPTTAWEDEYRRLGALDGDTLLTELFPVPKPGTGVWPSPYVAIFGFSDQNAYYDAIWPRRVVPGTGVSRRADVLGATLANVPLSRATYVFGYGRGGRRAEFWERFERLLDVRGCWTTVIPNVAEIMRHRSGAVVARLAHPSRKGITMADVPLVVAAIGRLS